ncbi:DUF563 domain-containing protein [Phenylobacterium sp.]|uniref:glycosyltransferase family 61 protein n=1 Tax=Phenylobacterium sp. TaxID=1871053 RepID=UPI0035B08F61
MGEAPVVGMAVTSLERSAVHKFQDATLVAGSSMVFSSDLARGSLLHPFNPTREYLQEEVMGRITRSDGGARFVFAQPPRRVARLEGDAVPLNLIHPNNYYHFLIEALPSIVALNESGHITPDTTLVTGILHPNMWWALQYCLGRARPTFLQLRLNQSVMCTRVVAAPPAAHAAELTDGSVSSYEYDWPAIRRLREVLAPLVARLAGDQRRKLFIRRRSPVRDLVNSEQLEQLATAAGYQVIDPGGLSFVDQVRIFSSASRVIGPTGAWAANLLLVPQDAQVTVLYPEPCRTGTSAWRGLGAAVGVEVRDLYCEVAVRNERQPIHSHFVCEPERLAEVL